MSTQQPPPQWQPDLGGPRQPPPSSTSSLAVTSLALGLSSYACFGPLTAVPAIAVGIAALFEIKSSQGTKRGNGLAIGGLVSGTINTLGYAIILALAIFAGRPLSKPSPPAGPTGKHPSYRIAPLPPTAPTSPAVPKFSSPKTAVARGTRIAETRTTTARVGSITVVDVGSTTTRLRAVLLEQRRQAKRHHEMLLVQTTSPECRPCLGVAAALSASSMQRALRGVRLVRVDVSLFRSDLNALSIPSDVIPGFFLLNESLNHPIDAIHGGEWDNDTAANISPVLGAFVRHRLTNRREPLRIPPSPPQGTLL